MFSLNEDDLYRLEGINIDFDNNEFQDDLPGTAVDTDEKVIKVKDALVGKGLIWQSYGAGKMVVQIIEKGLRLNLNLKGTGNPIIRALQRIKSLVSPRLRSWLRMGS